MGAAVARAETTGWELPEGAEIAPGRTVLKSLGGGSRYEAMLVWDEHLHAIVVAKVLRPDHVERSARSATFAGRPRRSRRLAHPVIVRGFGAVLEGPHPHLLIEHLEGPTLRRLIKRDGALSLQQVLPWRCTWRRRSTT